MGILKIGNKIEIFKTIPITKELHLPQTNLKRHTEAITIKQDQGCPFRG